MARSPDQLGCGHILSHVRYVGEHQRQWRRSRRHAVHQSSLPPRREQHSADDARLCQPEYERSIARQRQERRLARQWHRRHPRQQLLAQLSVVVVASLLLRYPKQWLQFQHDTPVRLSE